MSFLVIGVAVVLALGAVVLVATAQSRSATGRLSHETVRADSAQPGAVGPSTGRELEPDPRARAQETKAHATGDLVRAPPHRVARYEPIDDEELGVTRRQFFNRGILGGIALGLGAFGAASLAFLWPTSTGGFGGKVNVGSLDDVQKAIDDKQPYYNAAAKTYIQPYPKAALAKAAEVYLSVILSGMKQGYVALYQKCPHLGCRVPWCQTSQWFECPCHGSKYNRVGEKKGGPAPRGMDRFPFTIAGGSIMVDTGTIVQGPPIGTDTTGQGQEGAPCV